MDLNYDQDIYYLFSGRNEELKYLNNWSRSTEQVLFLTGMAGIGKTALIRIFEKQNNDYFKSGILNISAQTGIEHIFNILNTQKKFVKAALLAIDDIELLSSKNLIRLLNFIKKFDNLKIILSGRKIPNIPSINDKLKAKILNLSKLSKSDIYNIIRNRFAYNDDKIKIETIYKQIIQYSESYEKLLSTPRQINEFMQFISKKENIEIKNTNNLKIEIQNIIIDEKYERKVDFDYIGYLLAILLYISSTISSNNSENNIINEITNIKKDITNLTTSNNTGLTNHNMYTTTTNVNFRKEPIVDKNNIIKVLSSNQIIKLIKIEKGWANISYIDYIKEKSFKGWVDSRYIKLINISKKENINNLL